MPHGNSFNPPETRRIRRLQRNQAREEQAAQIEDRNLRRHDEVEERTAKVPELEQNVKKCQESVRPNGTATKDRLAGFETQLREAQAQLQEWRRSCRRW